VKFNWKIDENSEEAVTASVHRRTELIDELESLVRKYDGSDRIMGCAQEEWRELALDQIECIVVLDGKTWAIVGKGERYRLRGRLYEIEERLPERFFRINKSAIANRNGIDRFTASVNGAVDVVFRCGYRDYVSRRCFREIKRRLGIV